MSLYHEILYRQALINENRLAVKCDLTEYTYGELNERVCELARKIKENGVTKGDKVLLMAEKPIEFVLAFFAVSLLEAIPIPLYYHTGLQKVEEILEKYEINALLCDGELSLTGRGEAQQILVTERSFYLHSFGGSQDSELSGVEIILFTSGTTNLPKAIMLSKDNVLSNIRAISLYLKVNANDRILLIKNLSHSSSIIGELLMGAYNGCAIVMTKKIQLSSVILKILQEDEITIFFAVPTILKDIMSHKKIGTYSLSRLRTINFYGASMHYQDILKLIDLFPRVNVIYSYGQTEASPRVTYIEREDLLKHPASCGKPIEHVTVAVVDEQGRTALAGQKGEIVVTGPNVMQGYYKNPEKTKQVIVDGVLHTGDIGYLDEEGFLYVTGRRDNMIISAGKNIYLEEVENVIMLFDGVKEVLVQPKFMDNGITELFSYIVTDGETPFDKAALFQHCKQRMENYKVPKAITVVEQLEKTPSGKIKRNQFCE